MDALEKRQIAQMTVYANIATTYRDALATQEKIGAAQDRKEAAAIAVALGQSTRQDGTANAKDAMAGRSILENAYGRKAEDVVAVLSGRAANYDLPKGANRTEDMNKLVRQGQNLASDVNMSAYRNRGVVQPVGPNGHFLDKVARETEGREKLVQHMLNIKAAIEAQVERKQFDREHADFTYQRIQKEIFSSETPKARKAFAEFERSNSARLASEVAGEVEARYAAQGKTLARVSEKEQARADQASRAKAADFRTLKAEDAVKKHPDLVNAYAVVKAADLVAEKKFAANSDRVKFTAMMKERVAQHIEQNKPLPEVKMKDPEQAQRRESPALAR